MANYNTFLVQQTKGGKAELVTSSARKAKALLRPGIRIEVWNENSKIETIYTKTAERLAPYVARERAYIGQKQRAAEERNRRRTNTWTL